MVRSVKLLVAAGGEIKLIARHFSNEESAPGRTRRGEKEEKKKERGEKEHEKGTREKGKNTDYKTLRWRAKNAKALRLHEASSGLACP